MFDLIVKIVAIAGTLPVIASAIRSLYKKEISMDLLASVALVFSIISKEWSSAAFIALMVAAAKLLAYVTQKRAERNIRSLFKMRPEYAKVVVGEKLVEVPIKEVNVG